MKSARDHSLVAAYVAERSGSHLSPQQLQRLHGTVEQRLGQRTETEYVAYLKSTEGSGDLLELMSAIAVHKTDLFRDEVQLQSFDQFVLRPLLKRLGRPINVWSAGCATGEEVATLLILMHQAGAHSHSTVLGTDISEVALQKARDLAFHPQALKRVPPQIRQRYFSDVEERVQLLPELRQQASFVRHNLMDAPYPTAHDGGGFDVIFCRNVLIYFTAGAFDPVVDRLAVRLVDGGTLVLSAAEPLIHPREPLELHKCDEAFFYVRQDSSAPRPPNSAHAPRPRPLAVHAPVRIAPAQPVPRPPPAEADPKDEARQLFEQVMEVAAAGDAGAQTEQRLRKCLYLDPHFAQARYILGMLLEQRGDRAVAATEYRRALAALREGRAAPAAFFLNGDRLQAACELALRRLGFRS